MTKIHRLTAAGLLLLAGLVSVNTASAGPLTDFFAPADRQTSYSPFRFWAPRAAKAHDDLHGPKLSVEAPDRHPEISPTVTILKFQGPAVDPAATLIEPPTPPATSKFRY
jgi:hypothetical protein